MNLSFRRLLIWISLTLFFFFAAGQISSQNLNIRTYTYKDGLPTHSFFDAVQDTTGRMWFACSKGLTVYDGYEWKLLSVDDGVPMANYIKIKLDDQGRIWALPKIPSNQIIIKNKNQWSTIPPIINSSVTLDFVFWEENLTTHISVISRDNIFIFNGKNWANYSHKFPLSTLYFSIDIFEDKIYISTSEGLYILDKKDFDIEKLNLDIDEDESILSIFVDSNIQNNVKYILTDYAIYKFTSILLEKVIDDITISTSLEYENFFLVVDKFENYYFGNDIITYFYTNRIQKIQLLGKDIGEKSFGANSIFLDRENNKWITTNRGIIKLSNSPFFSYYKSDGLLSNEVSSLEQFDDGKIIVGHNDGFSILNESYIDVLKFESYNELFNQDSRVLDLINFNSTIYFTASRLGFGVINTPNNLEWNSKNSDYPFLTLNKSNDHLLVYKTDTLFKYKGERLSEIKTFNYSSKVGVREITIIKNQTILIATNGIGVVKIKGNENTLIKANFHDFNNTYAVFEQNDSTILVGTKGGLCKIQDSILVPHSIKNLTIEDPIYFIEAGNKPGSIWFGLDNGAIYWEDGKSRHYDPNSGLAGYETNRHAGFLDSKGNFWIGTDNGLSMFAAGNEDIVQPDPLIDLLYLEDMGFNRYDVKKNIKLSHDNNSFSIHFRCLSFIDESNILFYPKLLDADGEIIEEFNTREKSARFSNLLPGDYMVELSAINTNSIKSRVIRSNIITIESPFYNTIWFYFLVVIFFGFIAYSINRVISQKKYSKLLEKEVSERTAELENAEMMKSKAIYENIESDRRRISRDLHDELGQILTSAKLKLETFQLSNSIDDQQFEGSLDLINNTGQTLRKIVHNLHPLEIEKYGLDVSIKMLCDDLNSDSQISITSDIQKYNRGISKKTEVMVFRIIQEAINNAIKHSHASEIKVVFSETINSLVITIIDNGTGFNYSREEKSELQKSHFGLVNMNQRANFIGADLKIISKINLGTTVKLEVPLNDR